MKLALSLLFLLTLGFHLPVLKDLVGMHKAGSALAFVELEVEIDTVSNEASFNEVPCIICAVTIEISDAEALENTAPVSTNQSGFFRHFHYVSGVSPPIAS